MTREKDPLRSAIERLPSPRTIPVAPPVHENTRPGLPAPPAPGSKQPPRSLSPSPESSAAVLRTDDFELRLRKGAVRRFWPLVAPVVVSIAGASYGYARGYLAGLTEGYSRIVALEARVKVQGNERIALEARLDERAKTVDAALNHLAGVDADHDAKLNRRELDQTNLDRRTTALETKAISVRPAK